MLVSYKWLKELVPGLTATPHEIEEKMSTTGIEVEGVESPGAGLSKLVVGQVVSSEDIPETHLHLTKVNVGEAAEGELQIVCGAPNVRVGMKAIVALVGARIVDNIKIKKGKMRGFESQGMLCALDEIGVPESINPMKHEEGIFEMPEDAVLGESVLPYLNLDDEVIDLSITPNRADALSMRGVAYEVGAIYDLPVIFDSKELTESTSSKSSDIVKVKVETDKVPTYKIRIIKGVKIAPSPLWLQTRLMNAGVRPINNVVDVTNFILMYFGQPLHSFDFDKFGSDEILVRQAESAEKITTLDGEERDLTPEDIVITANNKAVALAGVMGGLDSEITAETTTVALESAIFDSLSIRKTSQKFALRSEASQRFEKGINEATVREALDYAAAMIAELAGGEILAGVVESNDYHPEPVKVSITLERVNAALGTELSLDEVKDIFLQLGFDLKVEGERFTCTIPARRWDIHIEADLVEEVARIYGYDKLPVTLPAGDEAGELTEMQKLRRQVRTNLEASGLNEIIGYSLTTSEKAVEFIKEPLDTTSLMMPLNQERETLRANMIPGMLDVINYNENRKMNDIAIYEVGNVFYPSKNPDEDSRPSEVAHVAIAISGNVRNSSYIEKDQKVDFFYLKGIVEKLLASYEKVDFKPLGDNPAMHPRRSAEVYLNGHLLGILGQVHPSLAKKYDIKETYVAELDLSVMLEEAPAQVTFQEISKIQASKRDLSILLDEKISHAQVLEVIQSSRAKSLSKVELFDVYNGENLPEGKKSMAYSLSFQGKEQSLTDEEINKAFDKITKNLVETLQVEVR